MNNFKYSILNPKTWFSSQKEKKIIHAHRHFYGESLDRALCDIEYELGTIDNKIQSLQLDKKYKRVSEYDYAINMAKLKYEDETCTEFLLEKLTIDLNMNKINQQVYNKERCTIIGEPFVDVINVSFTPDKPSDGYFELDWNTHFVEQLRTAGYTGGKDEMVVKQWFDTLCCEIAKENGATFSEEAPMLRKIKNQSGKTEIL